MPEDFVAWLDGLDDLNTLAHFSLRKLLAVARVEDHHDQERQLRGLVEGACDSIPISGTEPAVLREQNTSATKDSLLGADHLDLTSEG